MNTDYRAFARWPSYFLMAWEDFKPLPSMPEYEAAVARVHDRAVLLSLGLPNVAGLTPAELNSAASDDSTMEEVLDVVRLFQWLLPGLAFNVAFFREQLN